MRNLRLLFLSGFLCTTFLFSCSSSDEDPAPLTKMDIITASPWITDEIIAPDPLSQALFEALFAEYSMSFKTDGTYLVSIAGITGDDGEWEFNQDETRILFDQGTNDESEFKILLLENGKLHVEDEGVEIRMIHQ